MSNPEQIPSEEYRPGMFGRVGMLVRQIVSRPQEGEEPIYPQSKPWPQYRATLLEPTPFQKGSAVEAAFAANSTYDELVEAERALRAYKEKERMPESSQTYLTSPTLRQLLFGPMPRQIMQLSLLESNRDTTQLTFDRLTHEAGRVMRGNTDPYTPTLFDEIAAARAERSEKTDTRKRLIRKAKEIDEDIIQQLENTSAEEYARILLANNFSESEVEIAWGKLNRLPAQLFDKRFPPTTFPRSSKLSAKLEHFINNNKGLTINTSHVAELFQSQGIVGRLEATPGVGFSTVSAVAAIIVYKKLKLEQRKEIIAH